MVTLTSGSCMNARDDVSAGLTARILGTSDGTVDLLVSSSGLKSAEVNPDDDGTSFWT
jgi:hypothetical protein